MRPDIADARHLTLLTIAMIRLGTDTRAPRALQACFSRVRHAHGPVDPSLVALVADRAGIAIGDRSGVIAEAARRASEALGRTHGSPYRLVTRGDTGYPALLAEIPDPPVAMWVHGDPDALGRPSIAVVGSRNASIVGLQAAAYLGRELARAGLVVVSGLARGVDGAAHQGALDAGGKTIAVLGSGIDILYPRQHAELGRSIAKTGALVTEFPPGTAPLSRHFPLRNRIISGLSLATVVVEASERSGSLITARVALDQGRDVLAMPGNPLSGRYRGCHALIKDGAGLVETVDDVLETVGWTCGYDRRGDSSSKRLIRSHLLEGMAFGEPVSADELSYRLRLPVADCLAELGLLEVAGAVARTEAGLFVRLDGPATNRDR